MSNIQVRRRVGLLFDHARLFGCAKILAGHFCRRCVVVAGFLVAEVTVAGMVFLHLTGVGNTRTQSQQPNEQHHSGCELCSAMAEKGLHDGWAAVENRTESFK
ncbi:hypothetical protein [Rhodoferax sp.]|uniref:hypothetical protein n=1 Tax=Rhodoferax sp. TaxID=50421 RepID=UPI0027262A96|nr:hypothetical protein [Rhodoferax sp.]MDO9196147.1 hypothetical protein [Rhodoferax sp.]